MMAERRLHDARRRARRGAPLAADDDVRPLGAVTARRYAERPSCSRAPPSFSHRPSGVGSSIFGWVRRVV
jgi:hypothetical protein